MTQKMQIPKITKGLRLLLAMMMVAMPAALIAQTAVKKNVADRWSPGNSIHYRYDFVETIVGDIPLVITVPHGGLLRPGHIPKRTCNVKGQGSLVTGTDSKTVPLALAIQDAFVSKYGKRPYIIISHLARTQVDQNRPRELAACNNKLAEVAWDDFHLSADTALAHAVNQFGFAMYIDLHGHGHPNQRLELGYSLNGPDLREAWENEESRISLGKGSSVQNFLRMDQAKKFEDLLWGKHAFGTLIQNEGIPASPSMQDRYPLEDEKFFAGGYNTRRYTSAEYPNVFGWQIECNFRGVRDTDESRANFANAFANAYTDFMRHHGLSEGIKTSGQ